MADRETMSYLTAPLREVAQHHLDADETVLTAIYAHPTVHLTRDGWWFTGYRQIHYPARAFVLTPRRALIVEDPTDPAASTGSHEYLFASCALNHVMFFEMRSHILDCALTFVMATSNGPQRVTIEYNGVSENAFLVAVACMRALIVGRPLPPYVRPDDIYMRERANAVQDWHSALAGLELKQENAIMRYLVTGERVHEWLSVPATDESAWWQRFSIAAHEQPAAALVRTDRQILLIKEVKRVVRGHTLYGSEAWLMPLERLQTARVSNQRTEVWLTLEHNRVSDVVRLPIPPELVERTLALLMSHLPTSR